MSDTGEILFGKFPPAAPFDQRLRGFDLKVLLALCVRCDFKTMTTDHSGVQLAQDFAVHRSAVVRALSRLVTTGYLIPKGQSARHGNRYQVKLDNAPPVTPVAQVAPASPVPPVAQSPETQVSQVEPATCATGSTPPVPPVAHSPESSQKQTNGRGGAPEHEAVGPGGPGSYWTLPLEASDLEPGTLLVQTARDLGFARVNGSDGLQEQHAAFLRHRERRAYRKAAKRSEFRWWLQNAQKARASVTPPEKNSSTGEPEIAAKAPSTMPRIRVAAVPGTPVAWVDAWRATVADLEQPLGGATATARFGQGAAMLRNHNGTAQIVVAEKNLRLVREVYGAQLVAAWAKHMPAVTVQIVAAHPARGGTAQQAAE